MTVSITLKSETWGFVTIFKHSMKCLSTSASRLRILPPHSMEGNALVQHSASHPGQHRLKRLKPLSCLPRPIDLILAYVTRPC